MFKVSLLLFMPYFYTVRDLLTLKVVVLVIDLQDKKVPEAVSNDIKRSIFSYFYCIITLLSCTCYDIDLSTSAFPVCQVKYFLIKCRQTFPVFTLYAHNNHDYRSIKVYCCSASRFEMS